MTATQFANKYGFSSRDKIVVKKVYGNTQNSEEQWKTILSKDFVIKTKAAAPILDPANPDFRHKGMKIPIAPDAKDKTTAPKAGTGAKKNGDTK